MTKYTVIKSLLIQAIDAAFLIIDKPRKNQLHAFFFEIPSQCKRQNKVVDKIFKNEVLISEWELLIDVIVILYFDL